MKSVLEALNVVSHRLAELKIENARRQAEELLCDLLQCNRLQLYLNFEQPLSQSEWDICQERLSRRLQGEPLAYIQGSVEFYNCIIQVSPATLIPRQETEILVDRIAVVLSKEDHEDKVLVDLCCGSGCMGIALKKKFPLLKVILSDLSPAALEVAKKNAKANDVDVIFLEGDLLQPLEGQKIDYLVCNPPYISENEYLGLDNEVKDFEPKLALVSGVTGLEIYERLAKALPAYLDAGAKIWFEIGFKQGESLIQLFDCPPWKDLSVENDWSGHNRFFSATMQCES